MHELYAALKESITNLEAQNRFNLFKNEFDREAKRMTYQTQIREAKDFVVKCINNRTDNLIPVYSELVEMIENDIESKDLDELKAYYDKLVSLIQLY